MHAIAPPCCCKSAMWHAQEGLEPQLQEGVLPLLAKRGCRTGCIVEKEAVDKQGKDELGSPHREHLVGLLACLKLNVWSGCGEPFRPNRNLNRQPQHWEREGDAGFCFFLLLARRASSMTDGRKSITATFLELNNFRACVENHRMPISRFHQNSFVQCTTENINTFSLCRTTAAARVLLYFRNQ